MGKNLGGWEISQWVHFTVQVPFLADILCHPLYACNKCEMYISYLFADTPFIGKYHICISRITEMDSKQLSRGLGGCTEPTSSCKPHLIFADLLFHSFEEKKQLSMGGPDGIISGLILADFTFVNLTDQRQA